MKFIYLEGTRMPGDNYRRSLLCLSDEFRALINSLVY